jgi:serine/threonine protein phosphatase PrpC
MRDTTSGEWRAIATSVVHDPKEPSERKRINSKGSIVAENGRVRSMYGISCGRSVGDSEYKDLLPAEPDVSFLPYSKLPLNDPNKEIFVVLTCDGPFEGNKTEQFYANQLKVRLEQMGIHAGTKVPPSFNISKEIVELAYATGSGDNLSAITFKPDPNAKKDRYNGIFDGHSDPSQSHLPSQVANYTAKIIDYQVKTMQPEDQKRIAHELKQAIVATDKIILKQENQATGGFNEIKLSEDNPVAHEILNGINVSFSANNKDITLTFPKGVSRKFVKEIFGENRSNQWTATLSLEEARKLIEANKDGVPLAGKSMDEAIAAHQAKQVLTPRSKDDPESDLGSSPVPNPVPPPATPPTAAIPPTPKAAPEVVDGSSPVLGHAVLGEARLPERPVPPPAAVPPTPKAAPEVVDGSSPVLGEAVLGIARLPERSATPPAPPPATPPAAAVGSDGDSMSVLVPQSGLELKVSSHELELPEWLKKGGAPNLMPIPGADSITPRPPGASTIKGIEPKPILGSITPEANPGFTSMVVKRPKSPGSGTPDM